MQHNFNDTHANWSSLIPVYWVSISNATKYCDAKHSLDRHVEVSAFKMYQMLSTRMTSVLASFEIKPNKMIQKHVWIGTSVSISNTTIYK